MRSRFYTSKDKQNSIKINRNTLSKYETIINFLIYKKTWYQLGHVSQLWDETEQFRVDIELV
uniref:Uncharacterized protein n=1 Tax=Schistosoma mansoni TaxID=6183 RepID=A0A5K4FA81_SCHMA